MNAVMDLAWTLPSSSGREELVCNIKRPIATALGEILYLTNVSLVGKHWERDKAVAVAELVEDYRISLAQVIISRSAVEALRRQLDEWLVKPRGIRTELSGLDYQSLEISFGEREDIICTIGRPACTVRYAGNHVKTECAMVVDQSCIRLLRDDMARILAADPKPAERGSG